MTQPNAANFFAIQDVLCEPELVLIRNPKDREGNLRNSTVGRTKRHRILRGHLLEVVCILPAGETLTVPAAFVMPFDTSAERGIAALTGVSL
jgi:hypothetical protein